jgi:hypothetical protein
MPALDPRTRHGFGRVLVLVYAIFALAAGARSGVQIALQWHEAPLAYALSGVAAVVYIGATLGLAFGLRVLAWIACSVELAGVLVVGTLSLLDREAFPDATVWSGYGVGYGVIPLVLPLMGLWWLRRTRSAPVPH